MYYFWKTLDKRIYSHFGNISVYSYQLILLLLFLFCTSLNILLSNLRRFDGAISLDSKNRNLLMVATYFAIPISVNSLLLQTIKKFRDMSTSFYITYYKIKWERKSRANSNVIIERSIFCWLVTITQKNGILLWNLSEGRLNCSNKKNKPQKKQTAK